MQNIFSKILTKLILFLVFRFFESIKNIRFVLIRKSSFFPYIKQGSDLDILTSNLELFENEISKFINKYKKVNLKIIHKSSNHYQFDIFLGKIFFFKIDLISPKYCLNDLNNSEIFLEQILNRKKIFTFRYLLKSYKIFIPSNLDEIILRYLEFQNYPHKVHHKDYINSQSESIFEEINIEYSEFLKQPIKRIS